jgi:hypothetical protein
MQETYMGFFGAGLGVVFLGLIFSVSYALIEGLKNSRWHRLIVITIINDLARFCFASAMIVTAGYTTGHTASFLLGIFFLPGLPLPDRSGGFAPEEASDVRRHC